MNYASSHGNAAVARGISSYNAKSAQYCASNTASSLQEYTQLLNEVYTHNQTLMVLIFTACLEYYFFCSLSYIHQNIYFVKTTIQKSSQLNECVNISQIDDQFIHACCGQRDYAGYSIRCNYDATLKVIRWYGFNK
jgi:predicted alpha/beta-fold hydrolase